MRYLILCLMFVSGCAQLTELSDKTAERIARFADRYCEEVDARLRNDYRDNVNLRAEVSKVHIDCD